MHIRFGKGFVVATLQSRNSLLHLVCVTSLLLLLTSFVQVSTSAQDCPAEPSNCTCVSTAKMTPMETEIQCLNLGNLSQVFQFRNDNRTILRLIVTGSTIISRIQDGAFEQLNIREIRLSNLSILTIDSEAFRGSRLSEFLQILYLDQNQLVSLPETLFSGLHNLLQLRLNLNRLKAIEPNTFNVLAALNVLDLSLNVIEFLSNATFANLTNLQDLRLASNRIQVIQDRLFESLESLVSLDLSYNAIASVPGNAFRNMTLLTSLDISGNNLSSLPTNCFQYNLELVAVQAVGNRLENIDRLFYRTTKLETLLLSTNKLKSLKSLPFENTAQLKTLQLDYNLLENLEANQFTGLVALRYLYLQYNAISVVNTQTFAALYGVFELDISGNRLQTIPETFFDYLQNLIRLNVRENRISSTGQKPFDYLLKMIELDFSWNELPNIWYPMFLKNVNLQKLWLQGNRIAKIDSLSFSSLRNLTYLDLSQNWITEIPELLFQYTGKIEVLRLARNPLSVLSGNSLYGLVALKELYLNNTCLTSIESSYFFSMPSLTALYLQGNSISRLTSNSFYRLSAVKLLNISHNNISYLDYNAFTPLSSVTNVIMSHNSLNTSMMETMMRYLPYPITSLDLVWNNITSIQGIDPNRLRFLTDLFLAGNPLTCDCSYLNVPALKDLEQMTCTNSTSFNHTNYTTVLCYAKTTTSPQCSAYQTRNVTGDPCQLPPLPLEYNVTQTSDYDPDVCDPSKYTTVVTKMATLSTTTTRGGLDILSIEDNWNSTTMTTTTIWYPDHFNVSFDNSTHSPLLSEFHSDAYIYAVVITIVLAVLLVLTIAILFTVYAVTKKRKDEKARLSAAATANHGMPSAYSVFDGEDDALDWPATGNVEGGMEHIVEMSVLWMNTEAPENDDSIKKVELD